MLYPSFGNFLLAALAWGVEMRLYLYRQGGTSQVDYRGSTATATEHLNYP